MQGLARHLFEVEKRRSARDEVSFGTRLRPAGGAPIEVEVVNISRHGFMARTPTGLTQEDRVALALPVAGDVRARIAWSLGASIGAEFLTPIEPTDYQMLLAQLDTAS